MKGLNILKKKITAIVFLIILLVTLFSVSFSCYAIKIISTASAPKDINGEIYIGDTDIPSVSFTWTNVDLTKNNYIRIERANTTFNPVIPVYEVIRDNYDHHNNSYFDRSVVLGNTYKYRMYGVNSIGSAVSDIYKIYIPTATVIQGSTTTNSIKLNWTSDSKITENISLYRYTDADPGRVLLATFPITTKSYVDTSIKADTNYYYFAFTHKDRSYNIQSNTIKASTSSNSVANVSNSVSNVANVSNSVSTISNISSLQASSIIKSTSSSIGNSSNVSSSNGATVADSQDSGQISSVSSAGISSADTSKELTDTKKTNNTSTILLAIGALLVAAAVIAGIIFMISRRKT
jgi:hypothetical protein